MVYWFLINGVNMVKEIKDAEMILSILSEVLLSARKEISNLTADTSKDTAAMVLLNKAYSRISKQIEVDRKLCKDAAKYLTSERFE